jgi:hypothetical protein
MAGYIQTRIGVYQDVIASLRMYLVSSRLSQPVCTMTSASTSFIQSRGIRKGEQVESQDECIRKDEQGNAVGRLEGKNEKVDSGKTRRWSS